MPIIPPAAIVERRTDVCATAPIVAQDGHITPAADSELSLKRLPNPANGQDLPTMSQQGFVFVYITSTEP